MPDISVNKELWDGEYHWDDGGDEWSAAWGGSLMQWHGTILPRIQNLISGGRILEIASGYGRWSQFLEKQCDELVLVELSERCLGACKTRFRDQPHISYHLTDGKSLDMAGANSIDFVFSFDSLVHADASVLDAYIREISRVLSDGGSAFIHHSNLGEYGDF